MIIFENHGFLFILCGLDPLGGHLNATARIIHSVVYDVFNFSILTFFASRSCLEMHAKCSGWAFNCNGRSPTVQWNCIWKFPSSLLNLSVSHHVPCLNIYYRFVSATQMDLFPVNVHASNGMNESLTILHIFHIRFIKQIQLITIYDWSENDNALTENIKCLCWCLSRQWTPLSSNYMFLLNIGAHVKSVNSFSSFKFF